MAVQLAGTSWPVLVGAAAFVALAVAGLGTALFKWEFSKAARRRRRLRTALARAERERAVRSAAAHAGALTPEEARRLEAFRPKARLMADEPTRPVGWSARLRALWREGYAGWIIASLVGAFSMATHFGAYWLIAGGGWLGAGLVTLGSTVVMVAICLWVVLGLAESR
jgi:Flp pilus assembly protein TadB